MLKKVINLDGIQYLSSSEKKKINGGNQTRCAVYPRSQCENCFGTTLPNGCCLGSLYTERCLEGEFI